MLRHTNNQHLLSLTNEKIEYFLQTSPEAFHPFLRDVLLHSGKKMRPKLIVWIFGAMLESKELQILKKSEENLHNIAANVAACIEMLHLASLALDDIHDGSYTRRNKPSAHKVYGLPWAMNSANWLLFASTNLLSQTSSKALVSQALRDCHYGQALDLQTAQPSATKELLAGSSEVRWNRYFKCVELKTSRLLELGLETLVSEIFGSLELLSECQSGQESPNNFRSKDLLEGFRLYGRAFQMLDDLKNFSQLESELKEFEDLEACCRSAVFLAWYDMLDDSHTTSISKKTASQIAFAGKQALAATILSHEKLPEAIAHVRKLAHQFLEQSEQKLKLNYLSDNHKEDLRKLLFQ